MAPWRRHTRPISPGLPRGLQPARSPQGQWTGRERWRWGWQGRLARLAGALRAPAPASARLQPCLSRALCSQRWESRSRRAREGTALHGTAWGGTPAGPPAPWRTGAPRGCPAAESHPSPGLQVSWGSWGWWWAAGRPHHGPANLWGPCGHCFGTSRDGGGILGWRVGGINPSSPCLLPPLNPSVHPPPECTTVLLHHQGPSPLLVQPPPLLHLPLHAPEALSPPRAKPPLVLLQLCLMLPAPAPGRGACHPPSRWDASGQGTSLWLGDVVGSAQGAAQPRRCWRPRRGHSSCSGSSRERKRSEKKSGHAPLVPGLWLGEPRGD